MNLENFNYRPIKDFEDYAITECGKVISFKQKTPRIMTIWFGSSGYEDVKLRKNNKTYHKQVHRLVAEAFIPNPENKNVVHHKDNTTTNNHKENLEWVTTAENIHYSYDRFPPTRNFKECELHHITGGLLKSFSDKKSACEYAHEHFNCSPTSLMKYLKSREYKLILKV